MGYTTEFKGKFTTETEQPIDITQLLDAKWHDDQDAEKQYHIHPENQEGASPLGGCQALRAMKEAGIHMPYPTGAKADFGAAYVGTSVHDKIQRDLVPILQQQYPGCWIGPIIDANGRIHEVVIEVELVTGKKILSPLDLCVATVPGFVLKEIDYRNTTRIVPVLAPGAKFLAAWDIKSQDSFAWWKHQQEGLGPLYEAQGLPYLKATTLPFMGFLFVNKINYHMYMLRLDWSDEKWQALQAKRMRETELAMQITAAGARDPVAATEAADFRDDDFFYNTQDAEFYCAYCPLSETHDEETAGKTRVILDKPCPGVVARVESSCRDKFTVGSQWTRGSSFITIQAVADGKITSVNKSGKVYEDSVFHAAKAFTPGWEKPAKETGT